MASDPPRLGTLSAHGVLLAVGCYVFWGIVPIYWKILDDVAAHEMLVARILWTLVLMMGVIGLGGRTGELSAGASARTTSSETARETTPGGARGILGGGWLWSLASAGLLAINWGVFIWAVQIDQVLATSLGYFINPLMSVVLGMIFLGERLTRIQGLSVAIATTGVVAMTIAAGELPWIALVLATSFAVYGLLHKLRPQPPLGGLVREMLALSPFALAFLVWLLARGEAALVRADVVTHAWVALSGPVTALPLLLFHASTRRFSITNPSRATTPSVSGSSGWDSASFSQRRSYASARSLRDRQLPTAKPDRVRHSERARRASCEQTRATIRAVARARTRRTRFARDPWLTSPFASGKIASFDELSPPEILPLVQRSSLARHGAETT